MALEEWSYLGVDCDEDYTSATLHHFGHRQQQLVRRLVGDDTYNELVAPRITQLERIMTEEEDEELEEEAEEAEGTDLSVGFFDDLHHFLPCKDVRLDDGDYWAGEDEYDGETDPDPPDWLWAAGTPRCYPDAVS